MRLAEKLDNLTTTLNDALIQLDDLKKTVARLNAENERLRKEVQAAHLKAVEMPSPENKQVEINDTLLQLFNEGYHICPTCFGQMRDGECILCHGFLFHEQ